MRQKAWIAFRVLWFMEIICGIATPFAYNSLAGGNNFLHKLIAGKACFKELTDE